ncbi:MAG: hypothetical protein N3F08_01200 [Crenarchaeota archaeon]|nr:hypothetical protein [Thermoproteota archaeon]
MCNRLGARCSEIKPEEYSSFVLGYIMGRSSARRKRRRRRKPKPVNTVRGSKEPMIHD